MARPAVVAPVWTERRSEQSFILLLALSNMLADIGDSVLGKFWSVYGILCK